MAKLVPLDDGRFRWRNLEVGRRYFLGPARGDFNGEDVTATFIGEFGGFWTFVQLTEDGRLDNYVADPRAVAVWYGDSDGCGEPAVRAGYGGRVPLRDHPKAMRKLASMGIELDQL